MEFEKYCEGEQNMNEWMNQLHDIEGLDSITWWPLPIGWWVLLISGTCLLAALIYLGVKRVIFKRSWKYDSFQKLAYLEQNLRTETAKDSVILLSEYLRRIVLHRFSRKECAGLIGKEWLKWLSTNDPKQFDWEKNGLLLIEVPYAPQKRQLPIDQIKTLIQAVKDWVC